MSTAPRPYVGPTIDRLPVIALRNLPDAMRTLRALMATRSRNIGEVAEKALINQQTLGRYLSGRQVPGTDRLFMIADALDCDIALVPRQKGPRP